MKTKILSILLSIPLLLSTGIVAANTPLAQLVLDIHEELTSSNQGQDANEDDCVASASTQCRTGENPDPDASPQ